MSQTRIHVSSRQSLLPTHVVPSRLSASLSTCASAVPVSPTTPTGDQGAQLRLGSRVKVGNCKYGLIRYLGPFHLHQGSDWCGVELDEPVGKHDGTVDNRKYFTCTPGHGIMAPMEKVMPVSPSDSFSNMPRSASNLSTSGPAIGHLNEHPSRGGAGPLPPMDKTYDVDELNVILRQQPPAAAILDTGGAWKGVADDAELFEAQYLMEATKDFEGIEEEQMPTELMLDGSVGSQSQVASSIRRTLSSASTVSGATSPVPPGDANAQDDEPMDHGSDVMVPDVRLPEEQTPTVDEKCMELTLDTTAQVVPDASILAKDGHLLSPHSAVSDAKSDGSSTAPGAEKREKSNSGSRHSSVAPPPRKAAATSRLTASSRAVLGAKSVSSDTQSQKSVDSGRKLVQSKIAVDNPKPAEQPVKKRQPVAPKKGRYDDIMAKLQASMEKDKKEPKKIEAKSKVFAPPADKPLAVDLDETLKASESNGLETVQPPLDPSVVDENVTPAAPVEQRSTKIAEPLPKASAHPPSESSRVSRSSQKASKTTVSAPPAAAPKSKINAESSKATVIPKSKPGTASAASRPGSAASAATSKIATGEAKSQSTIKESAVPKKPTPIAAHRIEIWRLNRKLEAMLVTIRFMTEDLKVFDLHAEMPVLRRSLNDVQELLANSQSARQDLDIQVHELKVQLEQQRLECDQQVQKAHSEHLAEVERIRLADQEQAQQLVAVRCEELTQKHAQHMLDTETAFNLKLAKKDEALRAQKEQSVVLAQECEHLKREAEELRLSLLKDADHRVQAAAGKCQELRKEIDSLHVVLELRTNELHQLRAENVELQRQVEDLQGVRDRVRMLEAKNQDLKEFLESQRRAEQRLNHDTRAMTESLHLEQEENKRLSMANEQLQWRLNSMTGSLHLMSGGGNGESSSSDWESTSFTANPSPSYLTPARVYAETRSRASGSGSDQPVTVYTPEGAVVFRDKAGRPAGSPRAKSVDSSSCGGSSKSLRSRSQSGSSGEQRRATQLRGAPPRESDESIMESGGGGVEPMEEGSDHSPACLSPPSQPSVVLPAHVTATMSTSVADSGIFSSCMSESAREDLLASTSDTEAAPGQSSPRDSQE